MDARASEREREKVRERTGGKLGRDAFGEAASDSPYHRYRGTAMQRRTHSYTLNVNILPIFGLIVTVAFSETFFAEESSERESPIPTRNLELFLH
jgi:hypothetical protein